jgi:hypothetical protein
MNTKSQASSVIALLLMAAIFAAYVAAPVAYAQSVGTSSNDLPGMNALPDGVDTRELLERSRIRVTLETGATSTTGGLVQLPNIHDVLGAASSASSSTSTAGLGSSITELINGTMNNGSSTQTSGLGSAIADAITGGNGFGTSDIGPYIKCVLLAGIGWPIPTYSTECPLGTTTPPTKGTLTIIKNTVNGTGEFGFTLTGNGTATTTLSTSGGAASVNFILNPGTFTISEDTLTGSWTQTGRECVLNGSQTGTTSSSLGWSFTIAAGQHVTCTFTNSLPGGGGPGPGPGGGGGCVVNCGGGGPGPSSGTSPTGGNGPIPTGGGGPTITPTVAGAATSTPVDIAAPGIPNTGAGGYALINLIVLMSSFAIMLMGSITLSRRV